MDTGTTDVLFERRGPVAWVTFNRPQSRNAMTWAMYEALVRVCDAVEREPAIRVLVLRGAGDKAFVAGTDIGQFQVFTDPQHALDYEARMDAVVGRLETLPRPTRTRGECEFLPRHGACLLASRAFARQHRSYKGSEGCCIATSVVYVPRRRAVR